MPGHSFPAIFPIHPPIHPGGHLSVCSHPSTKQPILTRPHAPSPNPRLPPRRKRLPSSLSWQQSLPSLGGLSSTFRPPGATPHPFPSTKSQHPCALTVFKAHTPGHLLTQPQLPARPKTQAASFLMASPPSSHPDWLCHPKALAQDPHPSSDSLSGAGRRLIRPGPTWQRLLTSGPGALPPPDCRGKMAPCQAHLSRSFCCSRRSAKTARSTCL